MGQDASDRTRVRSRRSVVTRRLATATMAAFAFRCGGAVVSEPDDAGSPSIATGGGSSSGAAAVGGASSSGTWNVAGDDAGNGNGSASSESSEDAGDASSTGAIWTTIGTSPTCRASVSVADDGAGTCSVTLSGSCGYLDYVAICACPQAACSCQGPASSSTTRLTFRKFSTCPACPTAAQASRLCGFPF
jgi:hypothetical protein